MGTLVEYHIMNRFGYWAISNSASGGCDRHFSKWPTAVSVYDAYLPYWRGMQVDGERLFANIIKVQ